MIISREGSKVTLALAGLVLACACGTQGAAPNGIGGDSGMGAAGAPVSGASGTSPGGGGNAGGGASSGGSASGGAAASGAVAGAGTGGAGAGGDGAAGASGGAGVGGAGAGAGGGAGAGALGGAAGDGGAGTSGTGMGGAAGSGGAAGAGGSHAADAAFCADELVSAAMQYEGFRTTYANPSQIPRSASGGNVRLVGPSDWTSGFPAGSFWLLYEHTGDSVWRTAAEARTAALSSQTTNTGTHDVGFVINNTYGKGYRLTQTASYRTAVLQAAQSLASRFNATVGCTRSWDFGSWGFPVIIDNMMNLELLFHATELGGEQRFHDMAVTHAATTLANHFRADGSSFHLVDYNPATGAVVRKQTEQGLNDASAWARGQTWGLYGFTMVYRVTREQRFLTQAQRIADFYTQSPDMPADGVPWFDFDALRDASAPDLRDASAAAIAASALIELADFVDTEARERYLGFAIGALRTLSSPSYRAELGQNSHFLLMHSVGNYPDDEEVDVALNYADYYYLEALMRCAALP